jgi:hypothetical protein
VAKPVTEVQTIDANKRIITEVFKNDLMGFTLFIEDKCKEITARLYTECQALGN